MSHHATAELLSAYLDDELEERFVLRLVEHLEDCPECRERLASVRRVVATLQRLERGAPPPLLAETVQRRVALAPDKPHGLRQRLEERLWVAPQRSPLLVTFALVACLAAVVYVFAHGVERAHQPKTALIVGKLPQPVIPTGVVTETRTLLGGAAEDAAQTYELIDGLWRQQGIDQRGADLRIDAVSEEGRDLLLLHPGVETLGRRVLLRMGDLVVELYALPGPSALPRPNAQSEG